MHRLCALYTPETYFQWDDVQGKEVVAGIREISKARLGLICVYCRRKKGSCVQCSATKCTRAYHATCAAAAGVLVKVENLKVTGEDGSEHLQTTIDYRCKTHRSKRPKNADAATLESDPIVRAHSASLVKGDVVQMQFLCGNADIFAGVVLENRVHEETVVVQVLPKGYILASPFCACSPADMSCRDILEVEWKWILVQDSQAHFRDAGTLAAPLRLGPGYPKRITKVVQKDSGADKPFGSSDSGYQWGELVVGEKYLNREQEAVKQWWHYLGEQSTEYIPKYTDDPASRVHNPASNFVPVKASPRRTYHQPSVHVVQAPGYTMSLPPGYEPQYHNHQLIGYGPGPQYSYRSMAPMSPQASSVNFMQSSPHCNHGYSTQERPPAMSLPLQQLFGETQQPQSPSQPQSFSPITPVMQSPVQQHTYQQQQPRYSMPPSAQQYHFQPLARPQLYHSSPMPQSSGFIVPSAPQQRALPPPPQASPPGRPIVAATRPFATMSESADVSDITAAIARLARNRAEKEGRYKLVDPALKE